MVTRTEDGGCSCAAEKQYDAAYRVVQSRTTGVATLTTYNDRGQIASLTEAADTADERTAAYEYVYPQTAAFPGQILQRSIRRRSVAVAGGDKLVTEINDPATGKLLTRREQGFRGDGSALTAETVYSYSASGATQSIDGPRPGALDQIVYDYHPDGSPAAGMLWRVTEPNGAVTTYQQYDGLGNVVRKTDANNRDTTYSYNSRGLLQERTTVDGTTRFEYDARGGTSRRPRTPGATAFRTVTGCRGRVGSPTPAAGSTTGTLTGTGPRRRRTTRTQSWK